MSTLFQSFAFGGRLMRVTGAVPVVAALAIAAGGAVHAVAADPTAVERVPIEWVGPAGTACSGGTLVFRNPAPGATSEMIALIYPSDSSSCAAGLDVLKGAGPGGDGTAVALPLNANDCSAGTTLLETEISLIIAIMPGLSADSSPGSSASPCPGGDAAYADLQAALSNVPIAPGVAVLKQPGPLGAPSFVHKAPGPFGIPGIELSYVLDSTGTPTGHVVEMHSGQAEASDFLVPSGIAGDAALIPAVQLPAVQ
jgi:hypothetical protein